MLKLPSTPSLDALNYADVIKLIRYKAYVELINDIPERTRLLAHYPEIFDENVVKNIKALHSYAIKYSRL